MALYTIYLGTRRGFVPDKIDLINVYVVLLGLVVVPKVIAAACSFLGLLWKKITHKRQNWGNLVAFVLCLFNVYVFIYGFTVGYRKLEVKHIDIYSPDLPKGFDGYRIVHFSDAHVGTFTGWRRNLLQRDIDSINNQHADLIAFTGDLQNTQPQELYPVQQMLASLKAKDGVVSVLGNHDYAEYIEEDAAIEAANCKEIIDRQQQWGWRVLLNEHTILRRGKDSLVVAGEQNLEKPDSADFERTMKGIGKGAFVVFLQHNPQAWDQYIRPSRRAQLTLSGHVHGGQIALGGWSPARLRYARDYGLYQKDNLWLYVTSGIGALLPFRFGAPAEIVVITLHQKKR